MNAKVVRRSEQVGGGGTIPTCVYWLAGRCNKEHCRFLHKDTPSPSFDSKTKLVKGGEDETSVVKICQQSSSKICKYWANGNCAHSERCLNLHSWADGILINFQDTRQVWWTAPPQGFIKLNCDGAFCHHINKAAVRGVVRDWKGKFIFAFSGALRNCNSVMEAELCAIKIGMEMVVSRGFKNLVIESDSCTSIKFINCGVLRSHPLRHLVSSILQIGDKVDHICWNHIFREINSVADDLAKHGLSSSPRFGVKFYKSPPSFILMSLCADEAGIMYSR